MTSVYIKTLGCKVNQVESEKLAQALIGHGCEVSDDPGAILAVINSCAVTAEAEHKVRKEVRRALAAFPHATVLVAGCATVFSGEGMEALDARIVTEPDKTKLISTALQLVSDPGEVERTHAGALRHTGEREPLRRISERNLHRIAHTPEMRATELRTPETRRTRVAIKIQDGCDNFCTYCLISRVRGPLWSETIESVVAQAKDAYRAGSNEVILTGINLARFRDVDTDKDLTDLVNALTALEGPRVRLSSIEPPDLTPRLTKALSSPHVACHLHVPLQSGSDGVLAAMGRTYSTAEYRGWIETARTAMPGLSVTTDVIVGFPGETEEDFARTLAFCEEVGFSKLHVFKFSAREHTPAEAMGDQVDSHVKNERSRRCHELSDTLRARFVDECRERPLDLIVERIEGGWATGTSSEYATVTFKAPPGVRIGQRLVLESSQARDIL